MRENILNYYEKAIPFIKFSACWHCEYLDRTNKDCCEDVDSFPNFGVRQCNHYKGNENYKSSFGLYHRVINKYTIYDLTKLFFTELSKCTTATIWMRIKKCVDEDNYTFYMGCDHLYYPLRMFKAGRSNNILNKERFFLNAYTKTLVRNITKKNGIVIYTS